MHWVLRERLVDCWLRLRSGADPVRLLSLWHMHTEQIQICEEYGGRCYTLTVEPVMPRSPLTWPLAYVSNTIPCSKAPRVGRGESVPYLVLIRGGSHQQSTPCMSQAAISRGVLPCQRREDQTDLLSFSSFQYRLCTSSNPDFSNPPSRCTSTALNTDTEPTAPHYPHKHAPAHHMSSCSDKRHHAHTHPYYSTTTSRPQTDRH